MNINECDSVTVLKLRITAIQTSSVWKAEKNASERRTGLGDGSKAMLGSNPVTLQTS